MFCTKKTMLVRRTATFLCICALMGAGTGWAAVPQQVLRLTLAQNQEAVEIVLSFGFSGFKITKFYAKQAQKTLEVGKRVVIEQAVYNGLLNEFEAGVLDLNGDKATGLPRYNRALANDLFKSELTLQWSMVKFLEDRGINDRQNRSLKLHKEMLFSTQEAFERGNKDETTFNNLRGLRRALIRLRTQVR